MSNTGKQILEGIRILDLSVMTAGPVGTMLLADLGADVIKIEEPGHGDLSRGLGNLFMNGESVQFMSQNRNKRSIRIDLKQPEGVALFLRLAKDADVIVENFRPGTVKKLGIDYDVVKEINPGIIYASGSAFGQDGPYAMWPANDPIVQAVAGLMEMTGEPDGPPVRIGAPLPDFGTASMMAFGVTAALLHRFRTGEGQQLNVSLLSSSIFSTIPRDGETLVSGKSPERFGSGHPTMVPYRNYQGSDGQYFFAACFTVKFWANLCNTIGRPDLLTDPRFKTNTERTQNREALDTILSDIFATRPASEWVAILSAADVPAAKVQTYLEALTADPQVKHNKTLVPMQHPVAGDIQTLANPVNFSKTPATYRKPPPVLGEHSRDVLADFGFSVAEIAALQASGVVSGSRLEK
ncbi:MAG: coA-transferase family protein [Herminiimonas sp.]|nr:coA-transferase family protein [Herminiimonas sp.]